MSTKNAPAPAIKIKPPKASKGEPPKSAADTVVAGSNTESKGKLADMNSKVSPEFRRNVDLFCATHGVSRVSVIKEALEQYMTAKGWKPAE